MNTSGDNVFSRESLTNPIDCHGLTTATEAHLPGGAVRHGDLIACRGRRIIALERFWKGEGELVAQGRSLAIVNPDVPNVWRKTESIVFLGSDQLIMPVSSAPKGGNLRLILPPVGLGFDD